MTAAMPPIDRDLLPVTASTDDGDRLSIGGVDVADLAREYGTPLFVYDTKTLRRNFREARAIFGEGVAYASKAFLNPYLAAVAAEEGMYFDVSTAGEYECCRRAGVPPSSLVLHGNNKAPSELSRAVREGVSMIIADNFDELARLEEIAAGKQKATDVAIRINPGIEVNTHKFIATGNRESKFGFPVWTGDAERAIALVKESPWLRFAAIHLHIGSFVQSLNTFLAALEEVAPLVEEHAPGTLIVGGGLAVRYLNNDACPSFREWAEAVVGWGRARFPGVRILAEPGRAMVARAGVTIYEVGVVQKKGDIVFVAVDGGMSDNPRPMLYGSGYEVFDPERVSATRESRVRLVGKHCESGDTIVENGYLPENVAVGQFVCTPVTGAYGYTMASNYNMVPRPAVVFVEDGRSRLVTRRETLDDLFVRDVP